MARSIRLSPKHGVNPALMACPLCGKDTGVALHGRLPGDAEAPRHVFDRDPCESCRRWMERGIVLVEARVGDDQTTHLLGGLWVVSEEAARRLLTGAAGEAALKQRCAYIEPEAATRLGLRDIPATPSA